MRCCGLSVGGWVERRCWTLSMGRWVGEGRTADFGHLLLLHLLEEDALWRRWVGGWLGEVGGWVR